MWQPLTVKPSPQVQKSHRRPSQDERLPAAAPPAAAPPAALARRASLYRPPVAAYCKPAAAALPPVAAAAPKPPAPLCAVCRESPRNALLRPCGHVAVCMMCVGNIARCPICRKNIEETFHSFK